MTFEEFQRQMLGQSVKGRFAPRSLEEWKSCPPASRVKFPPVKDARKSADGLWYFVETDSPPVHTPTKIS